MKYTKIQKQSINKEINYFIVGLEYKYKVKLEHYNYIELVIINPSNLLLSYIQTFKKNKLHFPSQLNVLSENEELINLRILFLQSIKFKL